VAHGRLKRHPEAAVGACLLLVASLAVTTGCSGKSKRRWEFRSHEEMLQAALPEKLDESHPDERRDAVARLAEGNRVTDDDVFHVLDAVARTDPVTQIRCIAIRGLARYEDDRPVETLLAVLRAQEGSDQALPADDQVRWEAARALMLIEKRGAIGEPRQEDVLDVFLRMADPNMTRNVRIVAIDALGSFKDRRVFPVLIRSLRDEDFAIAERAENSLIALTGVTHQYDADAWEKWVANTAEPFAHAGETPEFEHDAGPSWWDRQKRAWRRGLKLGNQD
jgi:HEAT repeat protein